MTDLRVEIGQYSPRDKGCLRAFFTLVIYPLQIRISNCKYFVKGAQSWFSFPDREYEKDGVKKYAPYVTFLDKEYSEALKNAVIIELARKNKETPSESDGNQRQADNVPCYSSSVREEMPF